MSDREHHCPFLNRADRRCAGFFSIEGLQHAFEHCFDAYKACGVYHELLHERQARRGQGATQLSWSTAPKMPVNHVTQTFTPTGDTSAAKFVQVRLPSVAVARQPAAASGADGYAKPIA
jgi:hypothetical protein